MRISDWSSDVCSSDLFQKSIEARAPASIKALAVDLDCYARFSAERGGIGLPADEARLVASIDYCEARRLKPATVSRRLSSLAVAHHLLDVPYPVGADVFRDELRWMRRWAGGRQRPADQFRTRRGSLGSRRARKQVGAQY